METAQPLHPESKAVIELAAKLGVKPYTELTVEQARARSKASNAHPSVAGNVTYEGTRKELFIPLPDFTGTRTIIIQGFIQAPLGGGKLLHQSSEIPPSAEWLAKQHQESRDCSA